MRHFTLDTTRADRLGAYGFNIYPVSEAEVEPALLDLNRIAELVAPLVQEGADRDVLNLICLRGRNSQFSKVHAQ